MRKIHGDRKTLALVGLALTLAIAGCAPGEKPDTRIADGEAVKKADEDWSKAAGTKSVDAWMAFYTDDAILLPPNTSVARDKESIRREIQGLLGLADVQVGWKVLKVEVAKSGELAYTHGEYEMTFKDDQGKPVTDKGKTLEIWKKQADGSWKCAVDAYSSNLPPPPPTPAPAAKKK